MVMRAIVVALGLAACSSSTPSTSSTTVGSSSASTGAGGTSSASSSSGQGGAGGEQPLPDPDAGGMCVPNGGVTQMCDDATLLCPPMCCDAMGCICFDCRTQTDGVKRCTARSTDAGSCQ